MPVCCHEVVGDVRTVQSDNCITFFHTRFVFLFNQLITQLIWGSLEVSLIQTKNLEYNCVCIGPTHTKDGHRIETLSSQPGFDPTSLWFIGNI